MWPYAPAYWSEERYDDDECKQTLPYRIPITFLPAKFILQYTTLLTSANWKPVISFITNVTTRTCKVLHANACSIVWVTDVSSCTFCITVTNWINKTTRHYVHLCIIHIIYTVTVIIVSKKISQPNNCQLVLIKNCHFRVDQMTYGD